MELQDIPMPESLTPIPLEETDEALMAAEINERRARVENLELLQHLRGL